MRRWIAILIVAVFAVLDVAPAIVVAQDDIVVAQVKKRRTLMDLLFGDKEPEPAPAPPPQQQQQQPRTQAPAAAAAPAAPAPPARPITPKADNATRLAVFGDSLAVDLGKALDRFYAEDPNLVIIPMGVGSSGFVRDDFFDWEGELAKQIAANSFDVAVVMIGINDRQSLGNDKALTPEWTAEYSRRLTAFVGQLRAAGKPVVWIGLPPMSKADYSQAMSQISNLQRMAAFSGGAEFLDIYERFLGDDAKYSSYGPDLNGQNVRMRKDDGIHFAAAGADKLAFYVSQSLKTFYRGGGVTIAIADPLAGTDAAGMVRPPFQGLGQMRMLEVAGAVIPLSTTPPRAGDLLTADLVQAAPAAAPQGPGFDLEQLMLAPVGRVDAFGVGVAPAAEPFNAGGR